MAPSRAATTPRPRSRRRRGDVAKRNRADGTSGLAVGNSLLGDVLQGVAVWGLAQNTVDVGKHCVDTIKRQTVNPRTWDSPW